MKTNEIASKTGVRMSRIQRVSVNLKIFFLFVAACSVVAGLSPFASISPFISEAGLRSILNAQKFVECGIHLTWAAGCWFAYKLFSSYSRGDLFSAEIVRNLRRIGCVGILLGVGKSVSSFIFATGSIPLWAKLATLPFLFFSIIPGFTIICIAWIMDEGRKIQEEQELTV